MKPADLLAGLPGEVLLREGLADWAAGRRTIPACLVAIGSGRLQRAGLIPHLAAPQLSDAEQQLYQLLQEAGGDAYSRYNALLRELISFENALDRRTRQNENQKVESGKKAANLRKY
jgi:hypothetical protein